MRNTNRDGLYIAGRYFRCMADLEDYCFTNPDFEKTALVCLCARQRKQEVMEYFITAELEYGDGNIEATPEDADTYCETLDFWEEEEDERDIF